jgi:anaerobic ribonucleoside-triphosphate reductase activating protein
MGGDAEPAKVGELAMEVKRLNPSLKTCWYSGRDLEHAKVNLEVLDFVKVGPYIDEFGPLDSPTTNQRFYKIEHGPQGVELTDMTGWFVKKIF